MAQSSESAGSARPGLDRDLRSIDQARRLSRRAREAQAILEDFSQERVDAIVEAMAAAGLRESERLARMAHEETGFGNVPDKVAKNDFVLEHVVAAMRPMRTVGILREDRSTGVVEIAEPVGVVAGIIPSTNPTSTAMFKCLIALKARCGIVLSPHPAARECILASAEVMLKAAHEAGAPEHIIGCMSEVTLDGTHELMQGPDVDLILATGGMGLVKAAYSAGKPAYGVGPGNVPAYIEGTADVAQAVRDVFAGTTFDYGTLCSSEQSIVCDRAIEDRVRAEAEAHGGRFLSPEECGRLAEVLITADYLVNPELVGRPAPQIADAAGIDVPDDTTVLLCPLEGVGKDHPLSREKLSPVLAFYVVEDWREGCERCTELLGFGGMGHTLAIHSNDDHVVRQFGLQKPAHRVCVNTVAAVGAVGLTTNLFPSMTLGCGSWGNNITSDNVGPQHLLNVKRLAYRARSFTSHVMKERGVVVEEGEAPAPDPTTSERVVARTGQAAAGRNDGRARAGDLRVSVEDYLQRRGVLSGPPAPPAAGRTVTASTVPHPGSAVSGSRDGAACGCPEPPRAHNLAGDTGTGGRPSGADASATDAGRRGPDAAPKTSGEAETRGGGIAAEDRPQRRRREADAAEAPTQPVDFVSELDVRAALARGERIPVGPRTIITPLARELGEGGDVFRRR